MPTNAADELRLLVTGYRASAALCVAAELGVSDLLADGPRTVADLAEATSAHEGTLLRLLRALATIGVYVEQPDGSFANTPMSGALRSDVPGSARPLARTLRDPALWAAWNHLGHSVRTGENAFQALHGMDVWKHREQHPDEGAIFDDNMTALSSLVAGSVASSYDFAVVTSVVDVGGGHGMLLETLLAAHPHLTGIVMDQPHVVASAPSSSASPSVASRWSAVAGSFFDAVPPSDAYVLKSILHDWPDDECLTILRTCARSLDPGGVVLVVETVLGRTGHEVDAAFSDLNMLVLPGGRERTEQEYAALFEGAGLRLNRVVDTGSRFSVIEGRAASGEA